MIRSKFLNAICLDSVSSVFSCIYDHNAPTLWQIVGIDTLTGCKGTLKYLVLGFIDYSIICPLSLSRKPAFIGINKANMCLSSIYYAEPEKQFNLIRKHINGLRLLQATFFSLLFYIILILILTLII